ncbi:hypothetical protein [uncultured Marinobacter sp.]|uniref:hypothetical protein n=1 Tax=uncultured Marinobacter sp. TaxID=187379 RepID=UPI00261CFFD7|nr:hypothetical protein [uncultured Marinobacter sp.]
MWRDATPWQRFTYRAQRNPLVVLLSYPIIFGLIVVVWVLGDIADCFRYALWDEDKQRMVSYREAPG